MKESDFKDTVSDIINDYELLEHLQPSSSLNSRLINKLNSIDGNSSTSSISIHYRITFIVIIALNITLFFTYSFKSNPIAVSHERDLQIVSKEFLINPASIKN